MNKKFVERWNSDAFENKDIAMKIFQDVKKKLKTSPHPYCGWRSVPNQKLETITINENGLRSRSLKELKFKKNCILLGGSVAWGFGASNNENIPSYLIEKILFEKYKLELNVINLAEQVHTSFEEMRSFTTSVDELNPSLVICLSGANDVNSSYKNEYKAGNLIREPVNFFSWGKKMGITSEKNDFKKFIKFILRWYKKSGSFEEDFFTFKRPNKKDITNFLFEKKTFLINSYSEAKKIPVFHFLQPTSLLKKKKSKFEQEYAEFFGSDRVKYYIKEYESLKNNFFSNNSKDKNIFYFNLLNIFDNRGETIFFDHSHVTDKGYKILCEKICSEIYDNLKNI